MNKRKSGILLHITSLPGKEGIGTLGKNAYKFADWLNASGQTLWQVLPLGPIGYGDSPYASFSTFAGNPLLIDLQNLYERGWTSRKIIKLPEYIKEDGPVDFGSVVWFKIPCLYECAGYFLDNAQKSDLKKYENFKKNNEYWLNDYALFTSIKKYYDSLAKENNVSGPESVWNKFWPKPLAMHKEAALCQWASSHAGEIEAVKVIQFFFSVQWQELKKYCNSKKIKIIGDIPIFVASDSSDLWANQKLFMFDTKNLCQKACAGVPPDYFSATGQLWGNPLYNWTAMKKDGFDWWIKRIKKMSSMVDIIRIDHFRGFQAFWTVPYGAENAVNGKWTKGPGIELFNAIKENVGNVEIIAEDLGIITKPVEKLRDDLEFPGMKILQFAYGSESDNAYLPENYKTENCVVYTGTHDNDTTMGYINSCSKDFIKKLTRQLCLPEDSSNMLILDMMLKEAFMSKAKYCIIPLQDVYAVGSEGRINTPGTKSNNWSYRFNSRFTDAKTGRKLKKLTEESKRL